jgi:hypothetical protein
MGSALPVMSGREVMRVFRGVGLGNCAADRQPHYHDERRGTCNAFGSRSW